MTGLAGGNSKAGKLKTRPGHRRHTHLGSVGKLTRVSGRIGGN
jgi:hypothetical protein